MQNSKSAEKVVSADADRTRAQLDTLARSAMSQMRRQPEEVGPADLKAAADYLTREILDSSGFDQGRVLSEMASRRVDAVRILEDLVPMSAEALGTGWVRDELSFTKVSAASSRLFGLCKAVGLEWEGLVESDSAYTVLLVSFRREDHLLGPGVLAQMLRYRGHSVKVLPNSDAETVADLFRTGCYDCLMVSVASLVGFDGAKEELRTLHDMGGVPVPIVLGGKALDYCDATKGDVCADIVTCDVDIALEKVAMLKRYEAERVRT